MSYMIEIKSTNDIPEYLHGSDLFKNITNINTDSLDEESSFAIPCHNLKKQMSSLLMMVFFTYTERVFIGD